jgi:hypothetical protein
MAAATNRRARAMSCATGGAAAALSTYWPGFSSRTPSAPAAHAIGCPAFGLSVREPSRRQAAKAV